MSTRTPIAHIKHLEYWQVSFYQALSAPHFNQTAQTDKDRQLVRGRIMQTPAQRVEEATQIADLALEVLRARETEYNENYKAAHPEFFTDDK